MINPKVFLFVAFVLSSASLIGWIFWEHEIKYASPTPLPVNFKNVSVGTTVDLASLNIPSGKSTVLHFFNPDCPCSKFNMKDFESLSRKYRSEINFYIVLQSDDEDAVADFNERYELDLPVIADVDGAISDRCGIYATPQAVLLNTSSVIYFKGNYNKSRFCTRKETRYVEIALDSLIENKPLPIFVQNELTLPYGCALPSDDSSDEVAFLNLF
jgi:peroxiredoxin